MAKVITDIATIQEKLKQLKIELSSSITSIKKSLKQKRTFSGIRPPVYIQTNRLLRQVKNLEKKLGSAENQELSAKEKIAINRRIKNIETQLRSAERQELPATRVFRRPEAFEAKKIKRVPQPSWKKAIGRSRVTEAEVTYKTFYKNQVEPELWLHFPTSYRNFTTKQINKLKLAIQVEISEIFKQKYDIAITPIVCIEDGSIRVKIKLTLAVITLFFAKYGDIRDGIQYFSEDITSAWEKAIPVVVRVSYDILGKEGKTHNSAKFPLSGIEIQQHKGVIEKSDESLILYEKGKLTKEQCVQQVTNTFKVINSSDEIETFNAGFTKYIRSKFPTFPSDSLKAILNKREDDIIEEHDKYKYQ